jgi:phage terminase small subunit
VGDKRDLTLKQRKFCLAYVGEANGNGVESCRLAGYKGNDVTLAAVAYENLNKPQIQAYISELRVQAEKKLGAKVLSAAEVLAGLTRIASADVAEVFEADGSFDLASAKRRGVSRLIKSMAFDKDTGRLTKLELHNAHGAHVDLGKYHKLFTDRVEIVKPAEAAREAFQSILSETGISEEKAREIVAARFGISAQELITSDSVM